MGSCQWISTPWKSQNSNLKTKYACFQIARSQCCKQKRVLNHLFSINWFSTIKQTEYPRCYVGLLWWSRLNLHIYSVQVFESWNQISSWMTIIVTISNIMAAVILKFPVYPSWSMEHKRYPGSQLFGSKRWKTNKILCLIYSQAFLKNG